MELDLGNLVRKYDLNITGVVHIGANAGQEHPVYESLNIEPVIYFEPLPHIFEQLKSNVGDKATCYNFALGNIDGDVDMFVEDVNNGGSSSVLEPKKHLEHYPWIEFKRKINVPLKRVDDLNLPKCNFINIDVQGYELEVFKGASNYLKDVDYIMSEVNLAELYTGCAKVEDIDNFLGEYGFERVEVYWNNQQEWGDAFYIKKK
jgi:FkbM family methyltransferase